MSKGVIADIQELIALKRYAPTVSYPPENKALRQGGHLSKVRGRGMDFAEVRHYQPGDEIRHMEWRITAKTGKPHVKIYQEERERPVILLVDFSPSMLFGTKIAFKSVLAARLASLICWTAVKQGDRVGALLFSNSEHFEMPPRGRDSAVLPIIAALSRMTAQSSPNFESKPTLFAESLQKLRRVCRPGSTIVIISDFYLFNSEAERHLKHLRQHNDVIAYQTLDPLELSAPPPDQYAVSNGRHTALLDTRNKQSKTVYEQYFEEKNNRLRQFMKKSQIQFTQVTADKDLSQLLRQTYPRRRRT